MVYGETEPCLVEEKNIMAYFRRGEKNSLLVIGNFDRCERTVRLKELEELSSANLLLNNCESFRLKQGSLTLESCQALVLALQN